MRITDLKARDIRFPTSRTLDGSDALNLGNYSATYVTLETDEGTTGYGLTFTNGRDNEIGVAAALALAPFVTGLTLEEITGDFQFSLPTAHTGPATALDRTRKGNRPYGHRRGPQCGLGPLGAQGEKTRVEAAPGSQSSSARLHH